MRRSRFGLRSTRGTAACLAGLLAAATSGPAAIVGCGRGEARRARAAHAGRNDVPRSLTVNVLADTGRTLRLTAPPPDVSVSVARVTPARIGIPDPPLPPAAPDTVPPAAAPKASPEQARLLPPLLLRPGLLIAPTGLARAMAVELEVRVDERGRVVDVRWAGGDADTALVGAAERCAAAMQFYPALLGGKPVEVWCRQRFEFAPRR